MRYCPKCGERFSEDIIKFCTKDGTPLVEEGEPRFTAMPSQGVEDDIGDETVIRRRPFDEAGASGPEGPERFVIPTTVPDEREPVRPRPTQAYYQPPAQQPNTGKVVVLTILGTIFVLACGAGLFWLLQGERPANVNVNNINTNMPNINLNANNGFDTNFNFNMNSAQMPNINTNFNFNFNALANTKPTPSPRPTPTPRPSPSPQTFTEPSPRPPVNNVPFPSPRPRPPTMSNRPSNGT